MAIRPLFQGSGVKSPAVKLSADLVAFSGRIGHDFNRPELLLRAITHSSLSSATRPSNERLEFLGDRVLALSMAEALFQGDTDAAEGSLRPASTRWCGRKPVPMSPATLLWAMC
jgi:dsRNA-specific ribonuclease